MTHLPSCSLRNATSSLVRTASATLVAAALAACGLAEPSPDELGDTAALTAPPAALLRVARPIAGRYIVVLRKTALANNQRTLDVATAMTQPIGAKLIYGYQAALSGFAAQMTEADAKALLVDPRVEYITEDGVVEASATQTGATWGLDRIDQQWLPVNGNYSYPSTGAGAHAYVIDTGMRLTHSEFAGRVGAGFDAVTAGGNATDCNGHGTHVAGTIGGSTYGVAKGVTLHPVRVLDCGGSGTVAGVIAGIDWVTANHVSPAVANMSLGGGPAQAMDDAIAASIRSGVTYVVAAGNSAADACGFSPARTPTAITVGATDSNDSRDLSYSNFGSCVDLFAPGTSITSSFNTGDTATAVLSGTSMAAPHVTGVAALYLGRVPSATPAAVASRLVSSAMHVVANAGFGSPDLLLHNGLQNISLQTATGNYLAAENGGGIYMTASYTSPGIWEQLDVADLNGGILANGDSINLRVGNGSYMVAEGGGGGVVNANRSSAGVWETFRIWNVDGFGDFLTGDHVALQAANGPYVVAEGGGGLGGAGSVNANRGAIGPWETFVITLH